MKKWRDYIKKGTAVGKSEKDLALPKSKQRNICEGQEEKRSRSKNLSRNAKAGLQKSGAVRVRMVYASIL